MTDQLTDGRAAPEGGAAEAPEPAAPAPATGRPEAGAASAPATDTAPATVSGTGPEPAAVPVTEAAPAGTGAEAVVVPAAAPRGRRVLRAVARWTAAAVVCGGVGAGTALGITSLDRHQVPGLATESDGRWAYPALSLPALPADRPRPFTGANDAEIHWADTRRLLLPEPAGATSDARLTGGFVPTERYLALYGKDFRGEMRQALADSALRHVAARGWTMPDGTRTSVHVLRFTSVAHAQQFEDEVIRGGYSTDGVKTLPDGVELVLPEAFPDDIEVPDVRISAYREQQPYGPEQTRFAYVQAGDSIALVTLARKDGVATVPFQQTVTLQAQLLG
ncbi:hypothetical protein [Streptomyces omiyaensis]|uniref:hypothetical protein n=1 Tax=Streptomyces omiyaensis TaxID=68247 RepID=UPI003702F16A